MTTHEQTIEQLNKQLGDIEADIQAALNSLQARFTTALITTHQRRDRPDTNGRPGFFREGLKLDQHVQTVISRADLEKTTGSLNHKNWSSIVHAYMDMGTGCVDDANKIALRVDDLRNVLRIMHLLQERLVASAHILPEIRDPPAPLLPGPPAGRPPPAAQAPRAPVAPPPPPVPQAPASRAPPKSAPAPPPSKPVLKKPTPDLVPTPAESGMLAGDVPYDSTQRSLDLAEITFAELNDEEGDESDGGGDGEDEGDGDEEGQDEPSGPWRQVG
jgi:hypothetical protein